MTGSWWGWHSWGTGSVCLTDWRTSWRRRSLSRARRSGAECPTTQSQGHVAAVAAAVGDGGSGADGNPRWFRRALLWRRAGGGDVMAHHRLRVDCPGGSAQKDARRHAARGRASSCHWHGVLLPLLLRLRRWSRRWRGAVLLPWAPRRGPPSTTRTGAAEAAGASGSRTTPLLRRRSPPPPQRPASLSTGPHPPWYGARYALAASGVCMRHECR